jgi:hypothetical protein
MRRAPTSGTQVVLHDGVELAILAVERRDGVAAKVVIEQANIVAIAPATCMPLLTGRLSQFTRVCVLSVLYNSNRNVVRITQQDDFFARLPKAHHAARIVARTERTY